MSEQTQVSDQNVDDSANQSVSYETHRKLLGEKKRAQAEREALQAEVAEMRREREERENAQLAEQNKFKELYERSQTRSNELQSQLDGITSQYDTQRKKDAVLAKIGPLVNSTYSSFIDLESVNLEDADSIESAAAKFRKEHAQLIKSTTPHHSTAPAATMPGASGKPDYDNMSVSEIWASPDE
jgi:uncharacterized protein (DUF3084 family)